MKCWRWFRFCVPAGQALVIAGYLDLLIGLAKCLHSSMRAIYGDGNNRKELTEHSYHLDYLELTQATIEGSKILLALMLWIGVILIGRILILKIWIYLTISIDFIQLVLIGVINYHHWLADAPSVSPFHFIYLTSIRLLTRAYLACVAFNYSKVYSSFRAKLEIASSTINATPAVQQRQQQAQNELARELMPIGMGCLKLIKFYLGDEERLAKFLLISDVVWCICKVLSREVSQAAFGREESFYPSSSWMTAIMVEERFIRVCRIFFDLYFIRCMHKKTLGHQNWWILPKIMETIISIGILAFVIITEKHTFPTFVTALFCTFFASDVIFRLILFTTCVKYYGSQYDKLNTARRRTQSQSYP